MTTMTTATTSDDVELNVIDKGSLRGRPVVFVAGFTAPATSWSPQVRAFEEADHRVLALDRRGHGNSPATEDGHTMARHGADIHDLLEDWDLQDVSLVGASMGGNAIWAMVDQFGTDRVRDIVIVDQTPRMLNDDDWDHGFYGYDETNRDDLFAEGVPDPGVVSLTSKGPWRLARLLRALDLRRTVSGSLSEGELALLQDHARADWRDTISNVDVPVLFVAGRDSEFWPWEHAQAAAGLHELATWGVIDKCGHAANIEQPKAFNSGVLRFLAGSDTRRG
ncbi:MAG TPA: alpha/beta hydrolase [Nitriliruptoraceae bacterium]|nr:alpha/beta hydrolase [Nitriliruptoraceae bacterium]